MPTALDSVRYFGAHLSDNIAETPEGYRICRNAVIGRTGFQTYKVSELADPEGILGDDRGADEEIQVWRDPKEVFSPGTLASFEGKTFTLTHPEDLLDPDSEQRHHVGHVQNVRAGTEPLESGDLPMLADIIVTDRDAIRAIETGSRELSCGYTYKLAKEGYRYDQRQILGNHVALVPKGRAGGEARINDAAPTKEICDMNVFHRLFSSGFSFAKDAKAEDIAAANRVLAFDEAAASDKGKEGGKGTSKLVSIGKTKDGVEIFRLAAVDADGNIEGPTEAMDRGKRLHDALDKMILNSEKAAEDREKQDDASLAELQSLMNGFLGEKEKEATDADPDAANDAHPEGCRCEDCKDGSADDADKDDEGGEDKDPDAKDAEIVNAEPVLTSEERPKSQMDAQLTLNTLNALKPFIARAKDKKLTAAFDTAVNSIKKALKGNGNGKSGYIEFRTAASKASDRATESETAAQRESREFDERMAKIRKESRDRNIAARRR